MLIPTRKGPDARDFPGSSFIRSWNLATLPCHQNRRPGSCPPYVTTRPKYIPRYLGISILLCLLEQHGKTCTMYGAREQRGYEGTTKSRKSQWQDMHRMILASRSSRVLRLSPVPSVAIHFQGFLARTSSNSLGSTKIVKSHENRRSTTPYGVPYSVHTVL